METIPLPYNEYGLDIISSSTLFNSVTIPPLTTRSLSGNRFFNPTKTFFPTFDNDESNHITTRNRYQENNNITTTSTRWEDMNISSYVLYGGAFVLSVDSFMYPFEVLRTRMQADNITHQRGIRSAFKRIIRQDGFFRLYRGILPTVLGSFPAQSTYYFSYEYSHYQYEKYMQRCNHSESLSTTQDFLCHSLAGLTAETMAASFYLPADMISQRLQTQPRFNFHHNEFQYRGALDVIRTVFRYQGIKGFYCGLIPHLLAYAPSGAVYFGVYEVCKKGISQQYNNDNKINSMLINAVSASIAGGAAVCVSNPFDVLRTRIQTQHRINSLPLISIKDQFIKIWTTESLNGLFKGLRPRLVVAMPGSMITLTGYELIKSWSRE